MTMIDPAMGWFEITELPTYEIDGVTGSNDEYTGNSSDGTSRLFNNTWISRYPRPHKAVFGNGSKFKLDLRTPPPSIC